MSSLFLYGNGNDKVITSVSTAQMIGANRYCASDFGAVMYDDNGNIGKRYRRQDEIGTPYCVVVDFDTIESDNSVGVRDRDTMQQERVKIDELSEYFAKKLKI